MARQPKRRIEIYCQGDCASPLIIDNKAKPEDIVLNALAVYPEDDIRKWGWGWGWATIGGRLQPLCPQCKEKYHG